MTKRRLDAVTLAVAASLGSSSLAAAAGDVPKQAPSPVGVGCDSGAAQFVVGEAYSEDLGERARLAAGAETVRAIPFGLSVPMVYEDGRLTLQLDQDGKVESVSCG